jgi:tetratricopeptide (TPR) repeat protein
MSASQAAIARAREEFAARRFANAERTLLDALDPARSDLALLDALVALYLETGQLPACARVLARLVEVAPTEPGRYHTYAGVLERLGRGGEAGPLYERLVLHRPDDALAQFNLGCCLRREGRLEEALAAHERAIALGVEQTQDAWTNAGVILAELGRHDRSRAAFESALALDPQWTPALYNLALWHEEHGAPDAARDNFERVLAVDPGNHATLARLAHVRTIERRDDPLFVRLAAALQDGSPSPAAREDLHFALGKAHDDCGDHDAAFTSFEAGNRLARERAGSYDRGATEQTFATIEQSFSRAWLDACAPISQAPLVFVCGLFRTGSTLLEQMLAAGSDLDAGGEIGWLHARIPWRTPDWPRRVAAAPVAELEALGRGYVDHLATTFPQARRVIDKRPDNFLLLGLLKGLFPNARFLHTVRDPRDTALSIYFQQLGDRFAWANDLADIAHYTACHRALMAHWRTLFADAVLDVQYETLVHDPRPETQRVCAWLGAQWCEAMLRPDALRSRVRTASVAQVRRPLFASSVGRWRSYAAHLGPLESALRASAP